MEILILVIFTFIASIVGTTTSFGTSTFMIPALGFFYPFGISLLFTGIVHLFGNIWKMLFFRSGKQWRLILLFGIPGLIAGYFGAKLVPDISEVILSRLLGVFFIIYVIFLLKHKNWKISANKSIAITGGILSGFSSGIFGVGGAIRAAFLSAFNLKKEVFIFTAGAIGLFIDGGRVATYFLDGIRLENTMFVALAFAIPVSFLGGYVGKKISDKIPQAKFRTVIAIALLLMAIKYIAWPSVGAPNNTVPEMHSDNIPTSSVIGYSSDFNYRQTINGCGPFSVAAVVRALTGREIDSKEFDKSMDWRLPDGGTLPIGMEKQLKENGISVEIPDVGRLTDEQKISLLKEKLSENKPIIMLGQTGDYEHYITLFGFDDSKDEFYIYDSFYDKEKEGYTKDDNGDFSGNRTFTSKELLDFWRGGGMYGLYTWYAIVASKEQTLKL